MTRVLLVATTTGYQLRSFGDAARRAGVSLLLASDRCDHLDDPWRDGALAVRFDEPARAIDTVRAAVGAERLAGVLAVGDRPAALAATVAAAIGVRWHGPAAAARCRNKLESRQTLAAAERPVPWFRALPLQDDLAGILGTLPFPVVLKPLALSGSRGVIRANDPAELMAARARLAALLEAPDIRAERDAAHDGLIVEQFIPGHEFAVEGLVSDGAYRTLAVFDKPDPLDGPFFEETIYVTPSRAPSVTTCAIDEAVRAAVFALGLAHGPVHAECRVNEAGVYVLEVAARPIGGLCSKALRFITPNGEQRSLEDVLLLHAIGDDVSAWVRESRASGVMMIPIPRAGIYRGVDGVDDASAVAGVDEVRITAKPDTRLVPLPEGRSYLGFIFARGDDPAVVEQSLRRAHERLDFRIDRALELLPRRGR